MDVYAVVPFKGLRGPKKRLSPILSPQERKQLTQAMFEDVLNALQKSTISKIVIVSRDNTMELVANKFNAFYLAEKNHGLNSAIEEATEWCIKQGAEAVLVLPADIPLLTAEDVSKIIELGNCPEPTVVLSRSFDDGTNVLFRRPPNAIRPSFGLKSFEKHLEEGYSKGLSLKIYHSKGVAMDIDSAEDLEKLFRSECKTACQKVIGNFNFSGRMKVAGDRPKIS